MAGSSLTRICLRQLRRTIDDLEAEGIDASAVVIADDENLDTALDLGFGTIERNNRFLSRRFNDGIQLALRSSVQSAAGRLRRPPGLRRLDRAGGPRSTSLGRTRSSGFKRIAFVREDGLELTARFLDYDGGAGVRIYPRACLVALDFRPADEDRVRGCDTSILVNMKRDAPVPARASRHRPSAHRRLEVSPARTGILISEVAAAGAARRRSIRSRRSGECSPTRRSRKWPLTTYASREPACR